MSKKVYKETYFQHDHNARRDPKIKNLLAYFRRTANEEKAKSALLIYWWIIEDMHVDDYPVNKLEAFADDYRCDVELLKSILEDFELFRIENECYISDRVLRNLKEQEDKIEQKQSAANIRWLLADFNKIYKKEFGEAPILDPTEIETLKKYNRTVSGLKELLPDIIFTLKNLKFDTDINFKPCANWLLTKNNLARLINGEFGKLKHRKTEKEIKAEQEELVLKETERNQPSEFDLQMQVITGKAEAFEFIKKALDGQKLMYQRGKLIGIAHLRRLMERFDIKDKEVYEICQH